MTNFYTLELKLKRFKIKFKTDEKNGTIQFGGSMINFSDTLLYVIAPISIGVVFLLLTVMGLIPFMKRLTGYLIALPSVYGIINLFRYVNIGATNKDIKIIGDGFCKLITDGKEILLKQEDIKGFNFEITSKEDGTSIGILYLETYSTNHKIIGIMGEKVNFIQDDLLYFKNYFEKMIKPEVEHALHT